MLGHIIKCCRPSTSKKYKADEDFQKRLHFTRGILKFDKENFIGISVFPYEDRVKYLVDVSQECCENKHVHFLLIGEGEQKHYF